MGRSPQGGVTMGTSPQGGVTMGRSPQGGVTMGRSPQGRLDKQGGVSGVGGACGMLLDEIFEILRCCCRRIIVSDEVFIFTFHFRETVYEVFMWL